MYYWRGDSVPSTLSLCRPKGSLKDLFKHSTWEGKGVKWVRVSGSDRFWATRNHPGTQYTQCYRTEHHRDSAFEYFMKFKQTSWTKTPGLWISTAWQDCDLFNILWCCIATLGSNPQTKRFPDMQIGSSEETDSKCSDGQKTSFLVKIWSKSLFSDNAIFSTVEQPSSISWHLHIHWLLICDVDSP